MTEPVSNAASFVGRYISFINKAGKAYKDAIIIAYNPETSEHTVEYRDGTIRTLVLAKKRFKWPVMKCEPAKDRKTLFWKAARRDAVGRRLRIYNKQRDKWFRGTITAFNEEKDKHRIRFDKPNQEKELNLEKYKWRYTDLIGRRPPGSQSIASSRYAGVQRSTEKTWMSWAYEIGGGYIGTFESEKDAALAHDVYARENGRSDINFHREKFNEGDIQARRVKQYNNQHQPPIGKSKYRGVHWQKNRKRWMARYSLSHKGEKNINLGAFSESRHAALAFDVEARKRGRCDSDLNFPNEHPTDAQIEAWRTNTSHYSMMASNVKLSSQYRGVSQTRKDKRYHVQINIKKIVTAYGKTKGPLHFGFYTNEKQAALVYDRICRKHGVPEKELNFPRNNQYQKEVRLFDDECYLCNTESPVDPVATICNHVFCRACIETQLESHDACPSCQKTPILANELRPVQLIPWPKDDSKASSRAKQNDKPSRVDNDNEAFKPNPRVSLDTGNHLVEERSPTRHEPHAKYPVGTTIIKEFPGHGKFAGTVISFDGAHYKVHYKDDGDEEELSEYEFDDLELVTPHATGSICMERSDVEDTSDEEFDDSKSSSRAKKEEKASTADNDNKAFKPDTSVSMDESSRLVVEERSQPSGKYPVGTKIIKEFPGHGKFAGTVIAFDGAHYKVHYKDDGDEEELSEYEFDDLELVAPHATSPICMGRSDLEDTSDEEFDEGSSLVKERPRKRLRKKPAAMSEVGTTQPRDNLG